MNGLASEKLVTSSPLKEKVNFKSWVTNSIVSSNFFKFTQIWHFCNGLNPNKAQVSSCEAGTDKWEKNDRQRRHRPEFSVGISEK